MMGPLLRVLGSNGAAAALGFASTLLLSRTLSVGDFGRISLILALAAVLQVIISFGFPNALVIERGRNADSLQFGRDQDQVFFPYARFATIGALVPCVLLASWSYGLNLREALLLLLMSSASGLALYQLAIRQAEQQWNRYAALNISINGMRLFATLMFAVWAYLTGQYEYEVLLSFFIAYASFFLVAAATGGRRPRETIFTPFSRAAFLNRSYWRLVTPLGLTSVIIAAAMRIDALLIERMLGTDALGVYTVATSLAMAFPLITNALMNVYLVKASRESSKRSFLRELISHQARIAVPVAALGVAVATGSHLIVTTLFGQRYGEAATIFNWLLIAYLGSVVFTPIESYFYTKRPSLITYLKLAQLLIVAIGSVIFIPSFGLYAVAGSVVISRVLAWSYLLILARSE